jgi:hypothetical protein
MILGALLVGTVLLLRVMREQNDEVKRDWDSEWTWREWRKSRKW